MDRITADWKKELPDLDTRAIAVIGRLERASRLLEREIDRELGEYQLTIAEFNALCALRRSGAPYRLSPKQIGEALLFSSGGLTKLLERLEGRGLVTRGPDPHDGRGVLVCLTAEGKELGEMAMQAHRRNEEELLAPLSTNQREQLTDILRALLTAFEAGVGRTRPMLSSAQQPAAAESD